MPKNHLKKHPKKGVKKGCKIEPKTRAKTGATNKAKTILSIKSNFLDFYDFTILLKNLKKQKILKNIKLS